MKIFRTPSVSTQEHKNSKSAVLRELLRMQNSRFSNKTDETHPYARNRERFFIGLATIPSAQCQWRYAHKTKVLVHWAQHFKGVYNCPLSVSQESIECLTHVAVNNKLETLNSDEIPAEIYSTGRPQLTAKLAFLFCSIWNLEI